MRLLRIKKPEKSLLIVLVAYLFSGYRARKLKPEAKLKVLTDFVQFVGSHPEYEDDLVEATALVGDSNNSKTLIELGQYYLAKKNKPKALEYFEAALKIDEDNFNVLRNVLLLYIDLQKFSLAEKRSNDVLQKFPAQPLFYLINGVALNNLNEPKRAVEALEAGLDYIIDDIKMEIDFYKQLSIAYGSLNNTAKVKAQLNHFKKMVDKFKNHPALLLWGIGNELDLFSLNYFLNKLCLTGEDSLHNVEFQQDLHETLFCLEKLHHFFY